MRILDTFSNSAQTTLDGSIDNSQTTLDVIDASLFPTDYNFRLIIGNELLLVTSVSSNTFTVTRGVEGTSAAAHDDASLVTHVLTAYPTSRFGQFVVLSGTTTNATSTEIFIDGIANKRLTLPTDACWSFTVLTAAKNVATNESAGYYHCGVIEKNSSSTDIVGSVVPLMSISDTTTSISITADDTNDSLKIAVTGVLYNTWHWVCRVFWTEAS